MGTANAEFLKRLAGNLNKLAGATEQVDEDKEPDLEKTEAEKESTYAHQDKNKTFYFKSPEQEDMPKNPSYPYPIVKGTPQYPKGASKMEKEAIDKVYKQGYVDGYIKGKHAGRKQAGEMSRFYEEQFDEGFDYSDRLKLDKIDLKGRGALEEASDVPLDVVDMDAPDLGVIDVRGPSHEERFFSVDKKGKMTNASKHEQLLDSAIKEYSIKVDEE